MYIKISEQIQLGHINKAGFHFRKMPKRTKQASDSEEEPLARTKAKLTSLPDAMTGRNQKRTKKAKGKKAKPPASEISESQVEKELPTLESINQVWLH